MTIWILLPFATGRPSAVKPTISPPNRCTGNGQTAEIAACWRLETKKEKIAFEANEIEDVLNYLSGESYFTVNDYDKHYIYYYGDRKLLRHIEWDEPRMVKWRENEVLQRLQSSGWRGNFYEG